MTGNKRDRDHADRILSSLDAEAFDDADIADDLRGIDVKAAAQDIRATIARLDAARRGKVLAAADEARGAALAALRARPAEPKRPRAAIQLALRDLAARAGPTAVAQFQMKYDSASDEDLERMIAELRHLLGDE